MPNGNGPEVALTGIGIVCPLGVGSIAWRRLRAGETGDRAATGEIHEAMVRAVDAAIADSAAGRRGVSPITRLEARGPRCGWVLGVSKTAAAGWGGRGAPFLPWVNRDGSHAVADRFGATGPRLTPVAACATGVVALARGVDLIHHGTCDRVVCGAADASVHALTLASFRKLGVLTNDAARPFDAGRSGFALGEGAAAFVLERADLAAPGTAYATVTGSAVASAAVRLVDVDPGGEAVGRVLRDCTGGEPPDLLGLHGTATRANDPAEAAGVRAAFGAVGSRTPAFGSKGATGHLLGAAGAVELAFTLLALRDGVVPPTAGLRDRDPACDLDLSPLARPAPLRTAAKVSLGFGGTVAAVALRRGDRAAEPPPGPVPRPAAGQ